MCIIDIIVDILAKNDMPSDIQNILAFFVPQLYDETGNCIFYHHHYLFGSGNWDPSSWNGLFILHNY